jgi:hypothetical protein
MAVGIGVVVGVATAPVAGVVIAFVVAVAAVAWAGAQGRLALRASRARRLGDGEHPRFANLVEGVASDVGLEPPTAYVIEDGGANAFACKAGGPVVAASRSLLETFTRTELEAAVAHCIARLHDGGERRAARCSAFGPLAGAGVVVGAREDAAAAAVTRYPPALAAAISKAEARRGRYSPFYLVADDPSHEDRTDRLRALVEL